MRRLFLFCCLCFLLPAPVRAAVKPNFVIIFIDDMGYGDIGPFGAVKQKTPNLDRMAKEGMKLTSFYAAPVCSVSRAQLLTGCYGARVSVPGVFFPGQAEGLNPAEFTVAERLKEQGYATACIGKWHVGDQPEFLPLKQGFDHYFGIPYSNDMQAKAVGGSEVVSPLLRDDKVVELLTDEQQSGLVERYTDEALGFIKAKKDQPFLLYLPHSAIHTPIHPGKAFQGKSNNGRVGDWIEEVDWSTGRILDTLTELGIQQNTLVIFTSDNGPWLVKGADGGSAGPLRGGKGSTWEGGMREPTLAWWPGRIAPGSVSDAVAGTIDLLPTCVSLAGGTVPAEPVIDGRDLSPVLFGKSTVSPRGAHYYFSGYQLHAVRQGPWKLALVPQAKPKADGTSPPEASPAPRLYNLDQEINEQTDVASAHPEIVARLAALAQTMDGEIGGKAPRARRPAGVAAQPVTLYPFAPKKKTAAATPSRPNIVILYADDMGYGDLAIQNPDSKIPTPHLDQLAWEGTRFTDAHSSSGICTPSRYALLEGRYHWRKFHSIVDSFGPPALDDAKTTLPEMLRSKGYQTACIGKWHLGWNWEAIKTPNAAALEDPREGFPAAAFDWTKAIPGGPLAHGFDSYFGDDVPNFPPYTWFENDHVLAIPTVPRVTTGQPAEGGWEARPGPSVPGWDFSAVMPKLVERAVAWIGQRKADQPFFLYFPFTSPHAPMVPSPEFAGKSQAKGYGDYLMQTDDAVGRVLKALEAQGLASNTLVIFSSDNGPERYAYERIRNSQHRSMGALRGLKRDIWEGGHRVPLIVRWPGVVPVGKVNEGLISQIDLYATLAAITGADISPHDAEDSYNQLPLLKGEGPSARDTLVHNTKAGAYALRHGDWVLIDAPTGAQSAVPPWFDQANGYAKNGFEGELYNLRTDLAQKDNRYGSEPAKVAELKALLAKLRAEGQVRAVVP